MKKEFENIAIRPFGVEDIKSKVEIINSDKNNKFLHYDLPLEYERTLSWFEKIKDSKNRLDLTITYEDKIAGFIGLLGIDEKNKKAEYYICVDSNFSGKGIGTTATQLLLDYGFNELNLEKIYLYTEEENVKAQHLFEKVGFNKEGLLKNDIIYCGRKVNRFVYGLCKDDYYAKNTNTEN